MVVNNTDEMMVLNYRSDLTQLEGFSDLDVDSDGQPIVWRNAYHCDCGDHWDDSWSCQCDDDCPGCGESIEPESSAWIGPDVRLLIGLWETLPEKGLGGAPARIGVRTEAGKLCLAPGFHLVGIETPSVERAEIHPGLDAFVRQRMRNVPPEATVYMCDTGSAGSKFTRLAFGIVTDGKLEKGSAGSLRADRDELREFLVDWDARNILQEVEDDLVSAPGF